MVSSFKILRSLENWSWFTIVPTLYTRVQTASFPRQNSAFHIDRPRNEAQPSFHWIDVFVLPSLHMEREVIFEDSWGNPKMMTNHVSPAKNQRKWSIDDSLQCFSDDGSSCEWKDSGSENDPTQHRTVRKFTVFSKCKKTWPFRFFEEYANDSKYAGTASLPNASYSVTSPCRCASDFRHWIRWWWEVSGVISECLLLKIVTSKIDFFQDWWCPTRRNDSRASMTSTPSIGCHSRWMRLLLKRKIKDQLPNFSGRSLLPTTLAVRSSSIPRFVSIR